MPTLQEELLHRQLQIIERMEQHFIGGPYLTHNPNAPQRTIDGHPIIRVTPSVVKVITENEHFQLHSNMYMIQNMGNTAVRIFNDWTLLPKSGSIVVGSIDNYGYTQVNMSVYFLPGSLIVGEDPQNRLEVMQIATNHPEFTFMTEQGKTSRG